MSFPATKPTTPTWWSGSTGGEFAFGCVTGSFAGASQSDALAFDWDGNDEMDEACGDGWAELKPDGSLVGEINFHNGDEIPFIARPLGNFFNSLLGGLPAMVARRNFREEANDGPHFALATIFSRSRNIR